MLRGPRIDRSRFYGLDVVEQTGSRRTLADAQPLAYVLCLATGPFFAEIRRPHSARSLHSQGRWSISFVAVIFARQFVQLDDLSARQRLPPLRRREAFWGIRKRAAAFRLGSISTRNNSANTSFVFGDR